MKILFLCASLAPGRDGVGDYTARLAAELRSRGHECLCAAINDRFVEQDAAENGLLRGADYFRFSRKKSWSGRMKILRKIVTGFQPDWVSLQFVPYGFDPKGLPFLLPGRLGSIRGGFHWHVMFHELWIKSEGSFMQRTVSRLQKTNLVDLCRKLEPQVVHTSNENYARRLAGAGISSSTLPLFSNIRRVAPDPTLRQKLVWEIDSKLDEKKVWIFVFFGSIHLGWNAEEFLKRTSEAAWAAKKKAVLFFSIGNNRERGADIWKAMLEKKSESVLFRKIGDLPGPDISRHLQVADFGVATTPLGLLGKSGSASAMASHGLTTVVPSVDVFVAREILEKRGLVPMDELFEQGLWNPPKPCEKNSVSETADIFLQSLQPLLKTP